MPWGRHPQAGSGIYGRGQRELISVPVIPHSNPPEITHPQSNPLKRKQTFDFNRLGPKQRAIHNPANCSLELKKVPRVLNNITQLNNHFSKFGKIVNIQVNFSGDPEAALVTFQMPSEAKAAYRSTEAVLNNRFIKVFWHNNVTNNTAGGAIENVPPGMIYFLITFLITYYLENKLIKNLCNAFRLSSFCERASWCSRATAEQSRRD